MIELSPFEVVADTRGYYSANTMSGTRLNTKLEDLGSPISVVTKEQMQDFAMLDINDVFLYTTNTEGTGTYTEFTVSDSSQGELTDGVSGDPANANRIRSLGSANISSDNFETSNRVPLDPIDADGVEISRGPNANIFGHGNASGTVNIVGATANYLIGDGRTNGPTGQLVLDVNTRLLDGTPNPFFMRPALGLITPRSRVMPLNGRSSILVSPSRNASFRLFNVPDPAG